MRDTYADTCDITLHNWRKEHSTFQFSPWWSSWEGCGAPHAMSSHYIRQVHEIKLIDKKQKETESVPNLVYYIIFFIHTCLSLLINLQSYRKRTEWNV